MNRINEGYAMVGNSAPISLNVPKPDSLTACIERIAGMVGQLESHDDRFVSIRDRLVGSGTALQQASAKDTTEPSNIVFIAHAIEKKLSIHLSRMQENAIGLENVLF